MRRLATLIFVVGAVVGACSMPNFGPPKLGVAATAIATLTR